MQITINTRRVFKLLDVLLARWTATPKQYPYNRPDAIIPQRIIPAHRRANKEGLACFYFYACIYMRGGIESLQAFNALLRIWNDYPELFDPFQAQWWHPRDVQKVLKDYIGWDSKSASISWVENSKRLVRNWGGNPLNLILGLRSYDEALRRIQNKTTKRALREANKKDGRGEGFRGFQPKMVSMLLYFYDWEGWLTPRFLYPSPADFHNFRLGLANEGIVVTLKPGERLLHSEHLSAPWRATMMKYLRLRRADPLELADALWLFSQVLCGNSPLTVTRKTPQEDLFSHNEVQEEWHPTLHEKWLARHRQATLAQTCFVCPLVQTCTLAIPAQPYYRKGMLMLQLRPRVERHVNLALIREPKPREVVLDAETKTLLQLLEPPAPD